MDAKVAEAVEMECIISGFTSNLPEISYDWFYKEAIILPPNARYEITGDLGKTTLTIPNPSEYKMLFVCMYGYVLLLYRYLINLPILIIIGTIVQ